MDTNTAHKVLFDGLPFYFPPTEIRWRVGNVSKRDPDNPKGAALAYVTPAPLWTGLMRS